MLRSLFPGAKRAVQALFGAWRARARAGNVALVIGLSIPALATLTFGAMDISAITGDRSRMQSIADAAALSGARNLAVAMSASSATENARALAEAMITEWRDGPTLEVHAERVALERGAQGVKVTIDARRPSLFGDLLPPGGWRYAVDATAASLNNKPLCMLAFDDRKNKNFLVGGRAQIKAPACLIHSNGDLIADGGSVEAGQAEAAGNATGDIRPEPIVDAPVIEDPFLGRTIPTGLLCQANLKQIAIAIITTGTTTLPAGSHCGVIDVSGDATLVLAPGEHYFQLGAFNIRGNARLVGDDVAMIFDSASFFTFADNAQVRVKGRRTGANAGFVVMASRANAKKFRIDSTHVERLDGVIYIPNAELTVAGTSDIARQSDWTVIVARRLILSGNPHLYLNADYEDSLIETPNGVGPRPGGAALVD